MIKDKRILVLAPHTDDGELGCGAAISKFMGDNEIWYAAFSSCRQSVPQGFAADVLEKELQMATLTLGIQERNLILLDYEVRSFHQHQQRILDDLLKLKADIKPDVVFMPLRNDLHRDHATITSEAIRAFKFSTLLCYEMPWNNLSFSPACFVTIEPQHLEAKCQAVAAYESQAHRPYTNPDFIRSLATVRGVQAGVPLAEAFEVVRWIV